VPGRHRRQLEQGTVAARVAVAELALLLVPVHLEQALLDAMVEPGAAEDELPEPVDERLAFDERELLPVADEVPTQGASVLNAGVRPLYSPRTRAMEVPGGVERVRDSPDEIGTLY